MSIILIAEQDTFLRTRLADSLRQQGHQVAEACDAGEAMQHLDRCLFEVIVADLHLPAQNGFDILQASKADHELTPVLLLADADETSLACEALKRGAQDFVVKRHPDGLEEMVLRVERALQHGRMGYALGYLRRVHPQIEACETLSIHSSYLQRILGRLHGQLAADGHILIRGEPGTGKGLLAAAIHANSRRRGQTLVSANCAALPERVLEGELFGCEGGPIPGAHTRRIGDLEYANQGTLFLHHIGDLSLRMQLKVLRLLQEQAFERLGSSRTIHVDIRLVASTNDNLSEATRAKRFRAYLYEHPNAMTVEMPALRHCPEEILPLARLFLQRYSRLFGRPMKGFDEEAQRALLDYSWPGNLRELDRTIAHGVLHEHAGTICRGSLSFGEWQATAGTLYDDLVRLPPDGIALKEIERAALLQAMHRANWVQKDAAIHLDITPRVMNYKLKTHGITPPKPPHRR